MEIAALIISIIAIVVSVVTAVNDNRRDMKINQINLSAIYFQEIYKDHLIYKIPKARREMRIGPDRKLADTEKLIKELNDVRKDSLYYYYSDRPFYDELVNRLRMLEDYIVTSEVRNFNNEGKKDFFDQVEDDLKKIYSYIVEYYYGKKAPISRLKSCFRMSNK